MVLKSCFLEVVYEWIDLRVTRCPEADDMFRGELVAQWDTAAGQRVYAACGGNMEDANTCNGCGETEWDKLPEYVLNEDSLCPECAAEAAAEAK